MDNSIDLLFYGTLAYVHFGLQTWLKYYFICPGAVEETRHRIKDFLCNFKNDQVQTKVTINQKIYICTQL